MQNQGKNIVILITLIFVKEGLVLVLISLTLVDISAILFKLATKVIIVHPGGYDDGGDAGLPLDRRDGLRLETFLTEF